MSIGIYQITNLVENKIYIGQSTNLEKRKQQFFNFNMGTYGGRLINRKRKEYNNKDQWDYKILEECRLQNLNDKEKYWIKFLDARNSKKGYNILKGGDWRDDNGKLKSHYDVSFDIKNTSVVSINIITKEVKMYKSFMDACRENNLRSHTRIIECCYGRKGRKSNSHIYKGFIWMLLSDYMVRENRKLINNILEKHYKIKHMTGTKRPIYQINVNTGEIVNEYQSLKEAATAIGVSKSVAISNVCRGVQNTAYGFKWEYKDLYDKMKQ